MGQPVPATGFSIGVSRLQSALTYLKKFDGQKQAGPVVVTLFPGQPVADAQRLVALLRAANIRAELYLGNPKNNLGTQLKYADKRSSPCAIIQGGDEKAQGIVQIKDLILGAGLGDIKDREEYLKKQAEAQFPVKETDLVDAVAKLLARHKLA
jgi:histidyl-tRNA synthetase